MSNFINKINSTQEQQQQEEYEFDDDDSIIADIVSEHLNKRHYDEIDNNEQSFQDNKTLAQLVADGEALTRIFGQDGRRKIPGLPRRKKTKTTNTNLQIGGRITADPEPAASTSSASSYRQAPLFEITSSMKCDERLSEKFRRIESCNLISIKHNIKRQDIVLDVDSELVKLHQHIMNPFLQKCNPDDTISSTFFFEQLDTPIFTFCKARNFNPRTLQEKLYSIAQSKKGNFLDGKLFVRVAIIKAYSRPQMSGCGRWNKGHNPISLSDKCHSKKSVIVIDNKDNSCGFRAISVALYHSIKISLYNKPQISDEETSAYMDTERIDELLTINRLTNSCFADAKEVNQKWQHMRKSRPLQTKAANKIREEAGVSADESLNLSNIQQVEYVLDGIKIIVVNRDTKMREYPLHYDEIPERYICLEYIPPCPEYEYGHYNAITSIAAYMELPKFCVRCWVGETRKEKPHNCNGNCCKLCFGNHQSSVSDQEIICTGCNVTFYSNSCHDLHLSNKRCAAIHQCPKCLIRYPRKDFHSCLIYRCPLCHQSYEKSPHYCNNKPLDLVKLQAEDRKPKIMIAYDIESQLQDLEHKPVLLVTQTTCCHSKKDEVQNASCALCDDKEKYWMLGIDGCTNVVQSFIKFVMKEAARADKHKGKVLVYAHNSRGYDCHFILRELINLGYRDIKPLMTGAKIMKLTLGNVKFVDSLCLFQLPLKSLPKAFGLSEQIKKGDFPHKFNIEENLHKITPWPDVEYYEPEKKNPKEAEEIRKFAAEMKLAGKQFDFDKELLEYCRLDVKILLQSLVRFRQTFIEITGLDPVTRCFTLASIALETFKTKFYDAENTPLGITPPSYTEPKNHSMIGDAWMDWVSDHYASSSFNREQRVGSRWVDGAILELKKVFEYNGCVFHGCNKCFPDPNTPSAHDINKTMGELYNNWILKKSYLENLGFEVDVIWGCELDSRRQGDPILDEFIKERLSFYWSLKKVGHIKPRDALFGGRTNNIKFYCEADGNDSVIKYVDFTSLYPFEVSKRRYPIGHPRVVNHNFDPSMSFTGLSKCKVLPPKRLRFGVLPVKLDDRLVFPLCSTCATTRNQGTCNHTDEERSITGTWATPELCFAIREGYEIIKVYEELKFDRQEYDMFSGYIKLWMKEKQEASGWPSWCQTEHDKQGYIELYKQHEDVELDPAKIEHNPGRRFIAKLMLNSFWGKFAQRTNMGETAVLTDPEEYFQIIEDPSKEITADEMINENSMLVSWKYTDDSFAHSGNTNVFIAAFVTCYARLELLIKLKEIEEHRKGRVLYFDTDSIIYEHRLGDPVIETGDYLGQLTDEIAKDFGSEAKCIEFVSGGPKNYAVKVRLADGSEKVIIKAKGITLNEETREKITFTEMRRLVDAYIDPEDPQQEKISVDQFQIQANPKHMFVRSRYFQKIYRVVSEKRRIVGNDTLPFGYVDETDQ